MSSRAKNLLKVLHSKDLGPLGETQTSTLPGTRRCGSTRSSVIRLHDTAWRNTVWYSWVTCVTQHTAISSRGNKRKLSKEQDKFARTDQILGQNILLNTLKTSCIGFVVTFHTCPSLEVLNELLWKCLAFQTISLFQFFPCQAHNLQIIPSVRSWP